LQGLQEYTNIITFRHGLRFLFCAYASKQEQAEAVMICVHLNSVLLITPGGVEDFDQPNHAPDPWMRIEAQTVGDALRQVRFHKPNVLVFDLSKQRTGSVGFDRMLPVISEVRSRISGTSIVVLGASEDPEMESAVRRRGVTAYLTISGGDGRDDARRVIQVLHSRDGPNKAHGPPHSGVPPR
jgi:hypothetical protein